MIWGAGGGGAASIRSSSSSRRSAMFFSVSAWFFSNSSIPSSSEPFSSMSSYFFTAPKIWSSIMEEPFFRNFSNHGLGRAAMGSIPLEVMSLSLSGSTEEDFSLMKNSTLSSSSASSSSASTTLTTDSSSENSTRSLLGETSSFVGGLFLLNSSNIAVAVSSTVGLSTGMKLSWLLLVWKPSNLTSSGSKPTNSSVSCSSSFFLFFNFLGTGCGGESFSGVFSLISGSGVFSFSSTFACFLFFFFFGFTSTSLKSSAELSTLFSELVLFFFFELWSSLLEPP